MGAAVLLGGEDRRRNGRRKLSGEVEMRGRSSWPVRSRGEVGVVGR